MDSVRLKHLLAKYKEGNYTKADAEELLHYLHDADNRTHVAQLAAEGLFEGSEQDILSELEHERLDLLFSKISEKTDPNSFGASRLRWRARVARALIAAVFLSLLSIGYYFWRNNQVKQIIVTAGSGKVYDVKLPDGSRVWLNSGASLSYPELFNGDKRSVILTDGQAFFEVSENPNKPFTIKAGTLNVQVLGTSFEVSTFKDWERATVAVKTGSVKVVSEATPSENETKLTANQKATVNTNTGHVEVAEIDGDDIAGWKENRLIFTNEEFSTVLKALERKYDVNFEVSTPGLNNRKITLRLEEQPLEVVLRALSIANQFTYEVANDSTIIIK